MKKALITGITGQDGSYLAEFLLEKGYEVHGLIRRASISNTARIDHLLSENRLKLHDGDLSDSSSIIRIIGQVRPHEIYNLAAQSHVQVSFDAPEYSGDVDALGVLRILEAVRILGLTKTCRIYQASTSELYGKVEEDWGALYSFPDPGLRHYTLSFFVGGVVGLIQKWAESGWQRTPEEMAALAQHMIEEGVGPLSVRTGT